MKPLSIDLFCGLGGWTDGLLAEGWYVIGFDIEQHVYGEHRYPGQLVLQDVLTLHGSQFKDADLIVASPPCQEYSYMAMPWSRAKARAAAIRADDSGAELERLNRLFNACFRIQREASEAAGRHVPMVVENVKGAQPWVGRARWAFGSYFLWGDVPALMPMLSRAVKVPGMNWSNFGEPDYKAVAFNDEAARQNREGTGPRSDAERGVGPRWDPVTKSGAHGMKRWTNPSEGDGRKLPGFRFDGSGRSFQSEAVATKGGGDWFGSGENCSLQRRHASTLRPPPRRKEASALIAKIPLALSSHIARVFKPRDQQRAA